MVCLVEARNLSKHNYGTATRAYMSTLVFQIVDCIFDQASEEWFRIIQWKQTNS